MTRFGGAIRVGVPFAIKLFAPGLGDLIMTMPYLQKLVEKGIVDNLKVFVYTESQADMALCFPYVQQVTMISFTDDLSTLLDEREFYADMTRHPLDKIWWGSEEYIEKFGLRSVKSVIDEMVGGQGLPDKILPPEPRPFHVQTAELPNGKTVLLAPGGRRRTKLLPTEHWLEIADRLTTLGYEVGIIGAKSHKGSEQLGSLEARGLKHYAHTDISDLINIVRASAAVISIDSGLYHLSSILNHPTLGIFGPMPSWLWGGHGEKTVNLDFGCHINCRTAPLDWTCNGHPCMTQEATPLNIITEFERQVQPWLR